MLLKQIAWITGTLHQCTWIEKDAQWSHCAADQGQPLLYVICKKCTDCYAETGNCCVTLLPRAALLRKRTPRRWRWVAAVSWSGSSWSGGALSFLGPRRTPSGRTGAWLAPAWRSRCWNAARKHDLSICKHENKDSSHSFRRMDFCCTGVICGCKIR